MQSINRNVSKNKHNITAVTLCDKKLLCTFTVEHRGAMVGLGAERILSDCGLKGLCVHDTSNCGD